MKAGIFSTVMAVILTLAVSAGNAEAKGKEFRIASCLENALEPSIKLESWMMNDLIWNRTASYEITEERDEFLNLEEWMIHPALWEINPVEEATLSMEHWMLDGSNWVKAVDYSEPAPEKELVMESWMTDESNWK
ncbi:MAG: hypothetical protein ACOZDD_06845 [Bacteroidota bacterium]